MNAVSTSGQRGSGRLVMRGPHVRRTQCMVLCQLPAKEAGTSRTLEALDNLLGTQSDDSADMDVPQLWWQIRPKQEAAPRQHVMGGRNDGIFISSSDFLRGDVRIGNPTTMDAELQVPKVVPLLSYLILALDTAVFMTSLQVLLWQGGEAQEEFLAPLISGTTEVLQRGEFWRLATATLLPPTVPLALQSLAALAVVGPSAESLLGRATFAAAYLLPGAAAAALGLAPGPMATTAAASAATMGVLGATAGYAARNRSIAERDARPLTISAIFTVGTLVLVLLAQGGGGDGAGWCGASAHASLAGHAAGWAAGAWLGYRMGPRFEVSHEPDIPEGAMYIPDDAEESRVVIDQNTGLQRAAAVAMLAGAIATAAALQGAVATLG